MTVDTNPALTGVIEIADYTPTSGLVPLLIDDSIQDGVTDKAPDDNSVYDALALKLAITTAATTYATQVLTINTQADSYTLALSDGVNTYVRMNKGTANNLTVPPNGTIAFPVGTQIPIRQVGAGQTTIVEGMGVTVNTAETLKLRAQGSSASLIKVGTNEWDLAGDLETA